MSGEPLKVYKDRITTVTMDLGFDISGDTITSQIREQKDTDSFLIGTWDITVDDAELGLITLTFDDDDGTVTHSWGWMDFKRVVGGDAYPIGDSAIRVKFEGAVTD